MTNPHPLTAVVAMTPQGVIGKDGDMPWRLRSDLQRFKKLTMGGVLIMGRKTFDSIGRPLPGRVTIVITRDPNWSHPDVLVASSPDAALELLHDSEAVGDRAPFVVGGAQIYLALLPKCEQLLLTRVLAKIDGDTALDIDMSDFEILSRERIPAGPHDSVPTEFLRMTRQNS